MHYDHAAAGLGGKKDVTANAASAFHTVPFFTWLFG
jgi:hypothetical protein